VTLVSEELEIGRDELVCSSAASGWWDRNPDLLFPPYLAWRSQSRKRLSPP